MEQQTLFNNLFTPSGEHIISPEHVRISSPNILCVSYGIYLNEHGRIEKKGQDKFYKTLPYECSFLEDVRNKRGDLSINQIKLMRLPLGPSFDFSQSEAPFLIAIKNYCSNCIKNTPDIFKECITAPFRTILSTHIDNIENTKTDNYFRRVSDDTECRNVFKKQLNTYKEFLEEGYIHLL